MKTPDANTLKVSAVAHLRDLGDHDDADLLSKCKLEIGSTQRYADSTAIGLNITIRCKASDLDRFQGEDIGFVTSPSESMLNIQKAIESVLPVEFNIHEISARSLLVDRSEFEKMELERLIGAQKDLMIAVATGGPRIQTKNREYKERRSQIVGKLRELGLNDPNPFEDLWAWYGRWSSGDLPTYQSRREYIRKLYEPLLESLVDSEVGHPAEPSREPTGWEKVDRMVDSIINRLATGSTEEEYQTVGLLCRECLISLAQAVYDPETHKPSDGVVPSKTDANRMLDAYFSYEFSGSANEALRRHAKAALVLANELQHKRTADFKLAALCSEATRTVVNIVAISSSKR